MYFNTLSGNSPLLTTLSTMCVLIPTCFPFKLTLRYSFQLILHTHPNSSLDLRGKSFIRG